MDMNKNCGFSVYVEDDNIKLNKNFDSSFKFQNDLNNIYPKYINKWVDETLVFNCQLCETKFWYFSNKHHCRACGCVFCSKCCHKSIKIPQFIKRPKENQSYKQQIVNLYKNRNGDENLVCNICYNKIKNLENASYYSYVAEFFDLYSLYNMIKVSKKWYNICIHYLSKFREIQYISGSVLYDDWEINILKISSNLLSSHANWHLHIIKSSIQSYYDKKNNDLIFDNKNYCKKNDCWKLMCSRKCLLNLDIIDFSEILNFVALLEMKHNMLWKDNKLKNYIINVLNDIITHSKKIYGNILMKNTVPIICLSLIKLLGDDNDITEDIDPDFVNKIFDNLMMLYSDSIYVLHDEIYFLRSMENKTMGVVNLCEILNNYLKKIENNIIIKEKIKYMIKIISSLFNNANNINNIKFPILYPLDYNWNITKINKYTVMKSNSAPILLNVEISDAKKHKKNVSFLVKKENTLRKEQLVSNLISLLLIRLKQHEIINNKHFDTIPTYQIKMLSSNVGIIEFVENSITLREINDLGYTLQNYISENNKNEILDMIKKRFMCSLSISSCLSFLLGLGDRHLDNIMINKKGQIFNIDYGYLLENPKTNILGAPNIKVTREMIDFLGGFNSEYYKNFKEYLAYVYDIMRLYKNIISMYYEMIGREKFLDWNIFKDKLETKFMSGLFTKDIKIILVNEIESSSVSSSFNDTCHYFKILIDKKLH